MGKEIEEISSIFSHFVVIVSTVDAPTYGFKVQAFQDYNIIFTTKAQIFI